jgi:hypothetical protein
MIALGATLTVLAVSDQPRNGVPCLALATTNLVKVKLVQPKNKKRTTSCLEHNVETEQRRSAGSKKQKKDKEHNTSDSQVVSYPSTKKA